MDRVDTMRQIKRRDKPARNIKRRNHKPVRKITRRENKEGEQHAFFISTAYNAKCLSCKTHPKKWVEVGSRITLCPKCFKKHFHISNPESMILVATEKKKGIAEKLHTEWKKEFRAGGGILSDWKVKLDYVLADNWRKGI